MNVLSVFVDESGDSGSNSDWHIVSLVFHEQSRPIDIALAGLNGRLRDLGFPVDVAIHTMPLVRRKEMFSGMPGEDRKRIFSALFSFYEHTGCRHAAFSYLKRELSARDPAGIASRLQKRIARDIELFLRERIAYFTAFDKVVVYYDNGQRVVGQAVRGAFDAVLFGAEYRVVFPHEYRLLQAADLVCTLELLRLKDGARRLTKSDLGFFGSPGRLRRNYLRHAERLRLG